MKRHLITFRFLARAFLDFWRILWKTEWVRVEKSRLIEFNMTQILTTSVYFITDEKHLFWKGYIGGTILYLFYIIVSINTEAYRTTIFTVSQFFLWYTRRANSIYQPGAGTTVAPCTILKMSMVYMTGVLNRQCHLLSILEAKFIWKFYA